MSKVTLIQVIPLPPNKMLVDKSGDECECDIIAYFHSTYDEFYHEVPMAFGDLKEMEFDSRDGDEWDDFFHHMERDYEIVDRI